MPADEVNVLVVGAGPTGLTLAAQLRAFDVDARIVDLQPDQVHESRALAIQPRTLELLAGLGVADAMADRGNPAVQLRLHARGRTSGLPLFDIGTDDTAYPFLLFLSQAETEALLNEHLAQRGVMVERGVELTDLVQRVDHVHCTLTHPGGRVECVAARHVVGCDGAQSTVRSRAGIDFAGGAYPQTFVLADLDADGLEPGAVHVFLAEPGMLFFFPLGRPAPWRLLGWPLTPMPSTSQRPALGELQTLAEAYTTDAPRLREPVWATYFRLQHRHAAAYRSGRVFLAGDAAHVHSPAGAQGMNTGIQDAWNLGWKLALVTNGAAHPALLDTYQAERQPVGRNVLRLTDRAFTIATSTGPLSRTARTRVAPRLAPLADRFPAGRTAAFRTLAQLAIGYRDSPAVRDDRSGWRRPGPRAGDRLPDAPLLVDGRPTTLHRAFAAPRIHLLLTGAVHEWRADPGEALAAQHPGILALHRLSRQPAPGVLHDVHGDAHRRLALDRADHPAHLLVRPDGHIAYRADGTDLSRLRRYLARWYPGGRSCGAGEAQARGGPPDVVGRAISDEDLHPRRSGRRPSTP